jgi:hypothetical protein
MSTAAEKPPSFETGVGSGRTGALGAGVLGADAPGAG